jgi:hypothetical protein
MNDESRDWSSVVAMRRLLVLAAVSALVLVPTAQAKTLKLNWVEKTIGDYPAMTFKVKTLTVVGTKWSYVASVANNSKVAVKIGPGSPSEDGQYRFGLILPQKYDTSCHPVYTPCPAPRPPLAGAQSTKPRMPTVLRPGQTWSGTVSGTRTIPRGVLIRIAFGYFTDPAFRPTGFSFITENTFKL